MAYKEGINYLTMSKIPPGIGLVTNCFSNKLIKCITMWPQSLKLMSPLAVCKGGRESLVSLCLYVDMEVLGTCNCDAASREHLYSSLEVFDPVRGGWMELWFITDKYMVRYCTLMAFWDRTSESEADYTNHIDTPCLLALQLCQIT